MSQTLVGALMLLAATAAASAELRGVVVGITDGDTLTLLDDARKQRKIRLAGIDAPEKRQPFGERSKQNLSGLAFKKEARLDCIKVDQYKRRICRVWVGGEDIALAGAVSSALLPNLLP